MTSQNTERRNQFGKRLKSLRENAKIPQRVVAGILQIDSPMLSKIERGKRKAKKSQIELFANLFKTDAEELYTLWLAEQLLELIEGETFALKALQVAEDEVQYLSKRSGSGC